MTKLSSTNVECLVVAILAVNNWTVEEVWALLPQLREKRLVEPAEVSSLGLDRIALRLVETGYDRGSITPMFAERLQRLLHAVHLGQLDSLPHLVAGRNEARVLELLQSLYGVGPRVAATAWLLLSAD